MLSKMKPKTMPKSKRQCQNMFGYLRSRVSYNVLEMSYANSPLEEILRIGRRITIY